MSLQGIQQCAWLQPSQSVNPNEGSPILWIADFISTYINIYLYGVCICMFFPSSSSVAQNMAKKATVELLKDLHNSHRLNEASFFSTNESVITTMIQRYFTIELLNQQENSSMVKTEHYFKLFCNRQTRLYNNTICCELSTTFLFLYLHVSESLHPRKK